MTSIRSDAEDHRALSALKTEGWAALPATSISDGLEECVRRHAESLQPVRQGRDPDVLVYNGRESQEWLHPLLKDGISADPIRACVEDVERRIKTALDDEAFDLELVGIRRNLNRIPEGFGPHIDRRQYLTVVIAFAAEPADALGTVIYRDSNERAIDLVRLPARTAAIITGDQREAATGIPATIHSAARRIPTESSSDRCVLMFAYRRIDQAVGPDMRKNKTIECSARSNSPPASRVDVSI